MLGIPISFTKKVSEGYTFFLFFAGEKVYGIAVHNEKETPHSSLYVENVDPFLKDATLKIEKIISSCEEELGEQVYLKKTILFLNALYISDSGGIREDFRQIIKKTVHDLDLENLGYVNFYEAVNVYWEEKQRTYSFIEESVYDYTIYHFSDGKVQQTSKIAKTQSTEIDLSEIGKNIDSKKAIAFLYHNNLPSVESILEKDLFTLFYLVYRKNSGKPTAIEAISENIQPPVGTKEGNVTTVVSKYTYALAPGFKRNDELSMENEIKVKKPNMLLLMLRSVHLPQFPFKIQSHKRAWWPHIVVFFSLLLVCIYMSVFHTANIQLETKKENFSSEITFLLDERSSSKFIYPFKTKVEQETTGEKFIGERSTGEITVFNGQFEKRDLTANTKLHTKEGKVFTINTLASVPSATTSANVDAGVVTKSFGKKSVSTQALNIGAEGNIITGIKLLFDGLKEEEMYAVVSKNFTGGFRRLIRTFSAEDKQKLEESTLNLIKKELVNAFKLKHTEGDYLFIDSLRLIGDKKQFSTEVGSEASDVTFAQVGDAEVFYISHEKLIQKIQKEKLKDKEFVENTFQLTKVKKNAKAKNEYTAFVSGKVQHFVTQEVLAKKIAGTPFWRANQLIKENKTIIRATMSSSPISIPLIPWDVKKIKFSFEN